MLFRSGCAGVVVGRGCLGRPWLFRDLADVFAGGYDGDTVRWQFECESGPGYDFSKNVRWE